MTCNKDILYMNILLVVFGVSSLWCIDVSVTALSANMVLMNITGIQDANIMYHLGLIINTAILLMFTMLVSHLWVLNQNNQTINSLKQHP
jgi:hypothetical protein